jgi:hypothetical protein
LVRGDAGVVCTSDLVFDYPSSMTDLSIRFFDHGDDANCLVQWGKWVPAAEGEAFCERLAGALAASMEQHDAADAYRHGGVPA